MRHIIPIALLLAAMPAIAHPRFETLQAGSTGWITDSFIREHARCRPALPNGSPGAAVSCTVYYIPPMPGAPSDTPLGQHWLQFEFSGQSVQLPLASNSRNQFAYAPQPPSSAQAQNNGWTHFRLTYTEGKPIRFYSDSQMLSHLNRRK